MARKAYIDEFVNVLREWLPVLTRQSEEAGRESVQTVVWLVGLASGLVTLLAVNPGIVKSLSTTQRTTLVIALSAAVSCGVIQRIVYQLVERWRRDFLMGLHGYIVGCSSEFWEPERLDNGWDQNQIIVRLKDNFEIDFSILSQFGLNLDFYRSAYNAQYDNWHEFESEKLKHLGEVVTAYLGIPKKESDKMFGLEGDKGIDLAQVRIKASRLGFFYRAVFLLFAASCASFLLALLLLARAILP
jgi:hypothetical protein